MKNYIETLGVAYLEYAATDLKKFSRIWDQMGFICAGYRSEKDKKSKLYVQGDIRIVISAATNSNSPISHFINSHGEGVCALAYRVPSAKTAMEQAMQKGMANVLPVNIQKSLNHDVLFSGMSAYGDVKNLFVEYTDEKEIYGLFPENSETHFPTKGKYLQTVDHYTVNVERGKMDYWADFHQDVFGFHQVKYFDIRTDRTGLISRAMRNPNGRITIPFNEASNDKSQIQEYLNTFRGPGIQHLAFHTSNIIACLRDLRGHGFKFLTVPKTYYESIPQRVPNVTEDLSELEALGILVDGSSNGYLLQIFTENMVGPFFFEFIQRKGDNGFGEGNFQALFEAIERDQIRRGVL